MQFNVGFIKSENQFLLKTFNTEADDQGKILDLAEIKSADIQALFYESNLIESEELKSALLEDSKYFPIRSSEEVDVNFDNFEKLDFSSAKTIFSKVHDNWLLQNNVTLVEELFKVINHLNGLWPNDRTTFFEELWFILKSNLGAKSLRIIFNDIQMGKKEHEKNKLIQVKIEGDRVPNPVEGGELEAKIMKNYEKDFHQTFDVIEYDEQKGQLVMTGTIKKSPVVVMAEVYELNRMQKAIIGSLFEGLSQNFK